MNIMVLVPRVAQNFISKFPTTWHNAYRYFNYDRRVVDESVNRGDSQPNYKGPDDLTNMDYDMLVNAAKSVVNPILAKYDARVACEDALSRAIRSFRNGLYDNKVNADRYNVLLDAVMAPEMPVMAKGKSKAEPKKSESKKPKPKTKEERPSRLVMKGLGINRVTDLPVDTPAKRRMRERTKGDVSVVRKPGKGLVIEKSAEESHKGGVSMLKNASEYTEKLDKIAEDLQETIPDVALQIDMVSDVIEGRRTADTLKFDPDEARYMANRFNYDVRSRNADEPYMDNFNKSNFEQVMDEKKSPQPVKKASAVPYQKIQ